MFFSGIVMIFISQQLSCPPSKIEYRYMPRTLDQLMDEQKFSEDMFETTFGENGDIWIQSITNEKLGDSVMRS
jgi:hypothetical protein